MNARGRPAGRMTPLRKKAAEAVQERLARGERVIVAAVARQIGVDRRSARRIIRDVQALI